MRVIDLIDKLSAMPPNYPVELYVPPGDQYEAVSIELDHNTKTVIVNGDY